MWSSRSIATSDEEYKYDTWDIFLSSLNKRIYDEAYKHWSMYTRVPKNCKYTELKLYFAVYNYVYVVYFVILMNIQSSQLIAQDCMVIYS